ncbi:hypothetical protein RHMOL_Rhmol01G0068100 [Rhododendron molle]|uniref:Uncharacterized protein n=1 Tax=Rhododendron molle TaxID=49168 RepID=A0ACC0Q1S3_RHOML|nr:hypothetical protein RHMOL_Rhmol01G0068100 [Rhododendron molle]
MNFSAGNAGPGCSSIGGGAFTELGPFYPKGDGRGLRRNSMSWNRASNLLFVESTAGVGWSYSNTTSDYDCGDDSTARDMFTFMLKWYEKFPKFKSRDLILTGESYAAGVAMRLRPPRHDCFYRCGGCSVGSRKLQGTLEEMEDDVVVVGFDDLGDFSYVSVFDGHAGFSSVKFLRPLAIVVEWHVKLDKRLGHEISDHKLECYSNGTAATVSSILVTNLKTGFPFGGESEGALCSLSATIDQ